MTQEANAEVTVTKEQSEALEHAAKNGVTTRQLLRHNVHGDLSGVYLPLLTMHVEDLAQALIVGYEVEKSPEEKVLEYYDRCRTNRDDAVDRGMHLNAQHLDGQAIGASITLDILGISIEGVNA